LGFLDIAGLVEDVLDAWAATAPDEPTELDHVLAADGWARDRAAQVLSRRSAT
jgi:1-deoxy-D-xylulose 5-phosphate reductoisomerase